MKKWIIACIVLAVLLALAWFVGGGFGIGLTALYLIGGGYVVGAFVVPAPRAVNDFWAWLGLVDRVR